MAICSVVIKMYGKMIVKNVLKLKKLAWRRIFGCILEEIDTILQSLQDT